MEALCGTSGWSYEWNEGGSLDWYVKNSGLNAIELNSSFYSFPLPNFVRSWSKKGKALRWSIKVHRSITHIHMLNERSVHLFKRLIEAFMPMEDMIDWYLLQLPPHFSLGSRYRLERFLKEFKTVNIAVEFRNKEWYSVAEDLQGEFMIVSPDSPEIKGAIYEFNKTIYVRFHGRSAWYSHKYTKKELQEVARNIIEKKPDRVYAFFNNDHDMLENAKEFERLLLQ
ncbi:MAG: DUF72 domain-containing protein [Candidatus Micrarchaeaceae archaeon]